MNNYKVTTSEDLFLLVPRGLAIGSRIFSFGEKIDPNLLSNWALQIYYTKKLIGNKKELELTALLYKIDLNGIFKEEKKENEYELVKNKETLKSLKKH
ncbi:hypothetical protein [Silvanigrella sp.]|jgi:hypothetical protein|uniref:hypothetical protein n=1 Tax=Silvanigrella sp. TaxID=2024976 RepID=UPI0037C9C06C